MEVPHRDARNPTEGPVLQETIVRRLIPFDYVGDNSPIEAGMPPPLLDPFVIRQPVDLNALLPNRKRSVVEREGLRDLGRDYDLLRVREGHQSVPALPDLDRDLPCGVAPTVVMDHQ